MRLLIKLLIVLALAAGLGLLIQYHDGSVTIFLPPNQYELAPNRLALAILAMMAVGYVIVRLGIHIFRFPETIGQWFGARRRRQAEAALHEAVLAMHEGDLEQVDKLAERAQRDETTAGPAALMAARAAHMNGDATTRNTWLQRASVDPKVARARVLLAAEAALDEERVSDALAVLTRLSGRDAESVPVLRVKLRAAQAAEQWRDAFDIGRRLVRAKGMTAETMTRLRERALEALLEDAEDLADVDALYQEIGSQDAAAGGVIEAAAAAYVRLGEQTKALRVIERILEGRISGPALVLFTRLDTIPPRERLRLAERWQRQYDDDPMILATLGRLCIAEGLWGKAEDCLRAANEKAPSPFTRLALAEMYEAMGRSQDASTLYKDIARDQRIGATALPATLNPQLPNAS